ncbi:MAG: DUF4190 domain-containing protein [Phycisphaerales bacterium]|nr:DUF4190 domain-containing protein [Phycisphaerales bacterium]
MSDAPTPAAPPTRPGAITNRAALPVNRLGIWALVTGIFSLFLPPVGAGAIILGVFSLRRLRQNPGRERGQGVAIGGIVAGTVGVLMAGIYAIMAYSAFASVSQAKVMRMQANLDAIHTRAEAYARRHDKYPVHMGELAIASKGPFSVNHRLTAFDKDEQVPVTVGDYDLADFDGTAAETERLRAALAAVDADETCYRFGNAWFARLGKPTKDGDIIFAWHRQPETDLVLLMMDDGSVKSADAATWPRRLATDAQARLRHGLPPLDAPDPFVE